MKKPFAQTLATVLVALSISACARTVVRPETEVVKPGLPRPQKIVVHDFAVTEAELTKNHGGVDNEPGGTPEGEREREMGRKVKNVLAEELVRRLHDLGFNVEHRPRGTRISSRQLLIDGVFLDIDKGNQIKRLVIGFGAGASKLDTEVRVYYGANRQKLVDFRTHSDSGKMPGAAATMGAGAVVTGGVTAGMAVTSGAAGALKEHYSEIERMAVHTADQAAAYLSEFFAKEGWIDPGQVKRPKLGS